MNILINVVNQRLKVVKNISNLISGTQKFICFKFILDSGWDGLTIFAQFIQNGKAYNDFLDKNNCVYLPPEIVAGEFKLLLYGSGSNVIATTNYLTLKVDENAIIADSQSTEISQSLYDQLVTLVKNIGDKIDIITGGTLVDNLIDPELLYTGTNSGVTISRDGDTLIFNGTSTSKSRVTSENLGLESEEQYILEVHSESKNPINFYFTYVGDTAETTKLYTEYNTPITITVPRNTTSSKFGIEIPNGVTYSNDKYRITLHYASQSAIDTVARASLDAMTTALSTDVGKVLKVKTVTNGKVTAWEFGEISGTSAVDEVAREKLDEMNAASLSDVGKALVVKSVNNGEVSEWGFSVINGTTPTGDSDSYVTPEAYGAVGDGTTNDTTALSQAFNSGKPVMLTKGKNYFAMQITITNPLIVIGNFATISTRSITAEEYSSGGQRLLIFEDTATQVYIKDINFYTTADQTVYGAHGDRDPAIPNRSMRCAIAAYGVDKLSIVNCTFTNFDTPINGQRHGSDSTYEHIAKNVYLKDLQINNSLMGVIGYFRHIVVDGCEIVEDVNARSGEHCLYFLIDVLDTAIIANSAFYTEGDCGSCIQFYIPNTTTTLPEGIKREYRIANCMFFGDAFISNSGGGNCYASACTMKTINYKTGNRRRQFECAITDGGVIEVTDSTVNLELQDRIDQALIFRNCNIYSNRLLSDRFALYKAYGCQFDNVGFRVADGAEVINCAFSSSIGVLGRYYITVPSTTTASNIVDCIFNTGENVSAIAYQCAGACNLISAISELPIGTDNPGLVVIHKIDSTGSSDSGGDSGNAGSKVLFNGTANIVQDNPNYVALNDISATLTAGDIFRVTWNGIASTLTAKTVEIDGNNVVVIGNPGMDGATDDGSGLTYCGYKYSATVLAFSTTDSPGRISLKVEKIVDEDTSIYGDAIFIGDSICLGYNNDSISFADILSSRGIFSSVSKKAGIGYSTSNFTTAASEIPTGTWEAADIVYLCIQSDDMQNKREIGTIADTTSGTVSGSIKIIYDYIRNLNSTCTIVWLTFTKTNWRRYTSFTTQAWLKKWATIAMQKACALGMREIPFYDILNDAVFSRDGMHPNMAGHELIANLIQQNPYGDCSPVLVWNEIEPVVLFDGTATIRSDAPNYIILSNITDVINVGDKYRVSWNGTVTTLIAKSTEFDGEDVVIIGNPGVNGGTDDGSGLTYYGFKYSATALVFGTTDAAGDITLKVEKLEE